MALNSGSFRPCLSPTNKRSNAKPRELIISIRTPSIGLVKSAIALLRTNKRLKGYVQARPQQIVGIRKLYSNLSCLSCRVELVSSGDEATFVWVLVAGRQDEFELTLRGSLLKCTSATLKIHGSRRLTGHIDWIQLDNSGETALIAGFPGDVRSLLDKGSTDDAGDGRVEFHLLQSNLGNGCVCASFLDLCRRNIALRLCFQQFHFGPDIPGPQGLFVS